MNHKRTRPPWRRLHRLLVSIAAVPLALTALSGAIYGSLLSLNLDAPWLLRWHTGDFGVINLQPLYSGVVGVLTLVLIASGLALLPKRRATVDSAGNGD